MKVVEDMEAAGKDHVFVDWLRKKSGQHESWKEDEIKERFPAAELCPCVRLTIAVNEYIELWLCESHRAQ